MVISFKDISGTLKRSIPRPIWLFFEPPFLKKIVPRKFHQNTCYRSHYLLQRFVYVKVLVVYITWKSLRDVFKTYFKNEFECFIGVSNTRKLMKARGLRPSAFIVFECLKPRLNMKHEFLKLLHQQKKISLNYHLNRFSQFNYYICDVKCGWSSKKCAWCAWSYHLIAALWQVLNIHLLMHVVT